MADASVSMRAGERRPLFGSITTPDGTLTIQPSPAPTCTLYDSHGIPLAGFIDRPVTGYDSLAMATVQAVYDFDTLSPLVLPDDDFTLVFRITVIGSDSLSRVYRPSVGIRVDLPADITATEQQGWPNATQVLNLLQSADITLGNGADVDGAINHAVELLQAMLNRQYSTVTETRAWDGNNGEELFVTSLQSVSQIALVAPSGGIQEILLPTTWRLYPATQMPKSRIRRIAEGILTWGDPALRYYYDVPSYQRDRGFPRAFWPMGAQNIAITAVWGDAPVPPPAVAQAALYMAAQILLGAAEVRRYQGITSWHEKESTESYNPKPYANLILAWQAHIKSVVVYYARQKLLAG